MIKVISVYGTVVWPHEQDIAPDTIEVDLQPEPELIKPPSGLTDNRN
jgi:hypothetical protein